MAVGHGAGEVLAGVADCARRSGCASKHSDRGKAGGLTLASFDVAKAVDNAQVAEKIIHKLRLRRCSRRRERPDEARPAGLNGALENSQIEKAAATNLNPGAGGRSSDRVYRAERTREQCRTCCQPTSGRQRLPCRPARSAPENDSPSPMRRITRRP